MKVDLITECSSDLTVVNAARCSFDKQSVWDYVCSDESCTGIESCKREHLQSVIKAADAKLIQYLATHQHWTPFAHPQEVFDLQVTDQEVFYFLYNANLSGFEWECKGYIQGAGITIRGSLYAWCTNLQHLPLDVAKGIGYTLQERYPVSHDALKPQWTAHCQSPQGLCRVTHIQYPVQRELTSYTLRIHCPIFVKRQLETHRRNFVMTDIEDWSQNEVSRRYIDKEPEIWEPDNWRVQSTDKKQGSSSDVLDGIARELAYSNYHHVTYNSLLVYKSLNNKQVAHEQSRAVLPLGMYTTFWWTGSLKSWQRMFDLRLEEHAQAETKQIAQMCYDVMMQEYASIKVN